MVAHLKPQTFTVLSLHIHVPVAFYLARSDETVHYKSDEMVNICYFRCATMSPITVSLYTSLLTFIFAVFNYSVYRNANACNTPQPTTAE